MNKLGQRIKERREELGLSQEALAKKLNYTSRSTIAKIEADINDISQSKIIEFAKALNCSPAYLMGWDDNPTKVTDDEDPVIIRRLKKGTDKMDDDTKQKFMEYIIAQYEDYFNDDEE